MTPLIDLKGLTICTPERALVEDVEMVVYPGRVTALVGPSGAGKSLTARCSMGVIDVAPGLTAGTLRYPAVDPDKDWYEGIRAGRRGERGCLRRRPLPRELLHVLASGGELRAQPGVPSVALEIAIGRWKTAPADMGLAIGEILYDVGWKSKLDASRGAIRWNGSARGTAIAVALQFDQSWPMSPRPG